MAATNDLVKMVRLMAVTELLKTCRGEDGAFDPALVKAYVRSAYRKTAFAAHPDNNAQRPELHPYFTEAAEVWAFVDEGASNEELVRWAENYERDSQGTDPATEGMLRAAAEMIEGLQFERDDLQTRLTQAHANLVGVQRGQRRFTPDMVEVYSDPRRSVRITLANAATEISRLIAGRSDPALEQRLRDAERTLQGVRAEAQRTQAYANEQNRVAQHWQSEARNWQRQASTEASGREQANEQLAAERRERAALDEKYKAALRSVRRETEAREVQQRRADTLEFTLKATTDAASELLMGKLAEQRDFYEARLATIKAQRDEIARTTGYADAERIVIKKLLETAGTTTEPEDKVRIYISALHVNEAVAQEIIASTPAVFDDYFKLATDLTFSRDFEYQHGDRVKAVQIAERLAQIALREETRQRAQIMRRETIDNLTFERDFAGNMGDTASQRLFAERLCRLEPTTLNREYYNNILND